MKTNSSSVLIVPAAKELTDLSRSGPASHFSASSSRACHSHTIMLVEDDDDIRLVMTYFLENLGFAVIACANAESALRAYRFAKTVDLLMTDLQMPGRSGMELAFDLTAMKPALPVLIVSASILHDRMLIAIWQQGWAFLSKPCRFDSLVSVIDSLLHPVYPLAA